jgi:hypothetical protein
MGHKQKEKKKNPSSTGGDVAAAAAIAGGEALNKDSEKVDGVEGTGDASGFVPVDGSWVAELEESLDELEGILESPGGVQKRRGAALKVYLRLCRSFQMLRQWDKLDEAATEALKLNVCSSDSCTTGEAEGNGQVARFEEYREQSKHERHVAPPVPTALYDPTTQPIFDRLQAGTDHPDRVCVANVFFRNSNILQYSVMVGDVPLAEALVAARGRD